MTEAFDAAIAEALLHSTKAAAGVGFSKEWAERIGANIGSRSAAVVRELLRVAETDAELALQFIRQAQEALPKGRRRDD